MPIPQNATAKELMRWMLLHEQPADLPLDHPAQEAIAKAADEIERLQGIVNGRSMSGCERCGMRDDDWFLCREQTCLQKAQTSQTSIAGYPALNRLRAAGWAVAVHNDYRLGGKPHTFWLFTRGDAAIKGEGPTDEFALRDCECQAERVSQSPETANT